MSELATTCTYLSRLTLSCAVLRSIYDPPEACNLSTQSTRRFIYIYSSPVVSRV